MKKGIALICGAVLMCTLAACGGSGSKPQELKPSEYSGADFDASGDVAIETEYEVYGSDAPWVSYTVTNHTSEELAYGVAFSVEVLREGQWYQVPFPENTAWDAIGVVLKPKDTNAHEFRFSELGYQMADGQYRLIKEIGGKRYYGVFNVSKSSPITAETPFRYQALARLPADYTREAAIKNGDVVITYDETKNIEKLEDYVNKASYGMPAMVRVVQYTVEGDPIITEFVYNENGSGYYVYRHDNSRDRFGGAGTSITETVYSYLITDGEALYLSNCASWELLDTYTIASPLRIAPTVRNGDVAPLVGLVKEMTAERLKWNITRCRVFSPDAKQNVALYGGLSYGVEGLTSSETREVTDPDGIATEIVDVLWPDNESFVLVCKTKVGLTYFHAVGDAQSGYGKGFSMTGGVFKITK